MLVILSISISINIYKLVKIKNGKSIIVIVVVVVVSSMIILIIEIISISSLRHQNLLQFDLAEHSLQIFDWLCIKHKPNQDP